MGQHLSQCSCHGFFARSSQKPKVVSRSSTASKLGKSHSHRVDCKSFVVEQNVRATDFYKRVGDLGEGAFGEVWLGQQRICAGTEQERLGRLVAIKRVRKPSGGTYDDATDADGIDFRAEVALMKSLDHCSICRLLQVFEDRKNLYIVMEYIRGAELFDRIAQLGSFCEADAADVINQANSALLYCHRHGVVHRDIKPENIMVVDEEASPSSSPDIGPRVTIKVIDFGFGCQMLKGAKLKAKIGSVPYTAPEVMKGDPCDEKQDIWSLGCVLYVMLSGCMPFDGPGIKDQIIKGSFCFAGEDWKGITPEAMMFIKKLLVLEPEERLSAAQAVHEPWLKHCGDLAKHHSEHRKKPLELMDALKAFHEQSTFRHLCAGVMARQLDEALLHKLHCTFSEMDLDGNGILSLKEFKRACQELGPENNQIFFNVDMDGSGYVDYTEFIAACVDQKIEDQEGVCWAAFQVFDKNGDGVISYSELRDVLNSASMQSKFSPKTMRQLWGQLTGEQSLDKVPSGSVDYDAFVAALHGVRAETRDPLMRAVSTPMSGRSAHSLRTTTSAPGRPMTTPSLTRSPAPSPAAVQAKLESQVPKLPLSAASASGVMLPGLPIPGRQIARRPAPALNAGVAVLPGLPSVGLPIPGRHCQPTPSSATGDLTGTTAPRTVTSTTSVRTPVSTTSGAAALPGLPGLPIASRHPSAPTQGLGAALPMPSRRT